MKKADVIALIAERDALRLEAAALRSALEAHTPPEDRVPNPFMPATPKTGKRKAKANDGD